MKKLMIIAALMVAATVVKAASFNWQAANIYGPDLTSKYSGEVTLHCTQLDSWSASATAAAGAVAKSTSGFSSDLFSAGTTYDFYFTIETASGKFTSATKSVLAQQSDTSTINFANMQSATQNASNWVAVPEPTSGLLLILGVAGLVLKRKRA